MAMADELFNVIFRGDIVPGQVLADVKARFAQLFKLDQAKVDAYFTGKPVVLKKDCDRATADKFKAALQQAGAVVDIKSAMAASPAPAPRPVSAASPAPAVSVAPSPSSVPSPAAVQAATSAVVAGTWSLSPRGSDLLKAGEIAEAAPVQVSIDHISVVKRNPFAADAEAPLEPDRNIEPPALDLSAYRLGSVGETLTELQEFVPLQLDLSALSLDAPGADLLREDEKMPVMAVDFDLGDISLAPVGGELGEIAKPVAPPPPATDHLSLEK